MKRWLSILSFLLIATVSVGQNFFMQSLRKEGTASTEIVSASYDFDKIYYYEQENIDLTATLNVGVQWSKWEVREMETGVLAGYALGNDVSISTVDEMGFYKIVYEAYTATDKIRQEWDDILILDRRFTRDEADVIVDMSLGNYYNDFASADNTGLKVWVENTGTGYCYMGNLWGSAGYENYVRIQADGDAGLIQTGVAGSTGIGMSGARYVILDAHFDDKTVGAWENRQPENGTFDFRIDASAFHTNVIITGLKLNRQGYTDNAAFSIIGGYSQGLNASDGLIQGMAIHDCWIENSGAETIYINFTDDRITAGSPDFQPMKASGYIIAWNTIINAGNDGIQPCNSINHRIHDNTIIGAGVAQNQFHENGISYNAGNSGWVYNNFVKDVKMIMNIDSGLCPGCDLFNGDSTIVGTDFYNNVFDIGTYPAGGVTENGAIYIQYKVGYKGAVELPIRFWNNTFVTPDDKELMNIYFSTGGFTAPNFLMANNIVVSNPTGGDYDEVDFIGPGTHPTSEVINNLYYEPGDEAPVLFTDTAANNYRPSSLSSTAFSGTPEDISSYVSGVPLFDADGFTMTYNYYGAYSRTDLSTITPTVEDPDPASFDTSLTLDDVTEQGATINFELDKEGLVFWCVVANDATAPTESQLRDGGHGFVSGSVLAALSPSTQDFSGLASPGTDYDFYYVDVTTSNIAGTVTKVDFTTASDIVAPVLSGWNIPNANPNRLYFNSSEIITATTYGGFTIDQILGTTVTVTGVTINAGQTTGHYFTLSENVESIDYLARIAYSGSGSNLQDASTNALASFAATTITNNITYAHRIKINISNFAGYVGTSDWNDVNLGGGVGTKTLIADVNDDTGTPTGYVYAITNAFHSASNTVDATAGIYINDANAIFRGITVYNGGDNSGTLRLSGLDPGQAFDMIYLIKNTFGTGAGNVNINGTGAVGYTTGTVERKYSGVADASGYIDMVLTQTTTNTAEGLVTVFFDIN